MCVSVFRPKTSKERTPKTLHTLRGKKPPIWTSVLSLQLVSVFLCQPVPLQFQLMYDFHFILLRTNIHNQCTYNVFPCMYIYVLLSVLNKDQSTCSTVVLYAGAGSIAGGLVEEADDLVPKQMNERFGKHGVRDVGVFEVVVRLRDHLQQSRQQSCVLTTTHHNITIWRIIGIGLLLLLFTWCHLPGVATPGGVTYRCTLRCCGQEGQTDHVRSLKKSILSFLDFSNFPLNLLTVSQVTQSSLSWFHPSITLSDKKYFYRSTLHLCFTNFTECPLVLDIVLLVNTGWPKKSKPLSRIIIKSY